MSEEKTYQPHWGEKKHHHHHHHYHNQDDKYTNGWGGWLKMRDKQAYYGLMFIVIVGLCVGAFYLVKLFVDEIRSMPLDDPSTELNVDELRIHKVEEQDALLYSDSLLQANNLDSIRRTVQIRTTPVYRPPRRENKWYITQREWKAIWKDYKIMKWERKRAREQKAEEKRQRKESQKDQEE